MVNPDSLMAVSRGAAREAQAKHMQLERHMEVATTQLVVEEGYTLDFDIAKAIKSLPRYL